MPGRTPFDRATKDRFLRVYETKATARDACDAAGISYETHRSHLAKDPEWRAEVDGAQERYIERLEAEADRRAVEGIEEIRYHKDGEIAMRRRVFSDRLLELLLKRYRKKEFANVSEVTQHTTVKKDPAGVDISKLTDEERLALRVLLEKAGAGDDEQ